jgi:hypothetical protein
MLCPIFRIIEIIGELDISRLRHQGTEMLMWEDDRLFGIRQELGAASNPCRDSKILMDLVKSCMDTAWNYRQYARMKWITIRERKRKNA